MTTIPERNESSNRGRFLDPADLAAMNLTNFRENALLKLQVGGPFQRGIEDIHAQEYVVVQVEQTAEISARRKRVQQVRRLNPSRLKIKSRRLTCQSRRCWWISCEIRSDSSAGVTVPIVTARSQRRVQVQFLNRLLFFFLKITHSVELRYV